MDDNFFMRLLKQYEKLNSDAERRGFLKAITLFEDFLTEAELKEVNKWANKMLQFFPKSTKKIIDYDV